MILGFQQRLVPSVTDGTKPHTIRAGQRWREGLSIQFYQNVRQASMAKIRPDAVATVVQAVRIERGFRFTKDDLQWPIVTVDGRQLTRIECATLASTDGFDTAEEFANFFASAYGLPFEGQLIGWTDLRY